MVNDPYRQASFLYSPTAIEDLEEIDIAAAEDTAEVLGLLDFSRKFDAQARRIRCSSPPSWAPAALDPTAAAEDPCRDPAQLPVTVPSI